MLDNLFINIGTILPSAKQTTVADAADSTASYCSNRCQDDDKFNRNYSNDSAITPFLKYRSNCDDDAILNQTTANNRTMLHVVRSYFSQLYQSKRRRPASSDSNVDSHNDAIMLPRVYNYPPDLLGNWDPIELKVKEKCIEDIDNVIDKFVRVIRVNENSSPIRPAQFYVHILTPAYAFFKQTKFKFLNLKLIEILFLLFDFSCACVYTETK